MTRKLFVAPLLAAVAALGLTVGLLSFPSVASAWDWHSLPAGYSSGSRQVVCHVATDPCIGGEGSICNLVTVRAYPAGGGAQIAILDQLADCVNANFQVIFDAFIDSTICQVNPAAGQAAGLCAPPATTTAPATTEPPATTTAATTTPVTTTTTVAAEPSTTTTASVEAPPAPPTVTTTVTTTVVVADPALELRVSALEQRQAVAEGRIAVLEANTGMIQGESKSEAPFNRPA
jgi:hypothetical protein